MFNDNYPERKRNRLKNYNYSRNGWYFITICTKNRTKFFGKIVGTGHDRSMILNKCGEIVKQCWLEIPNHFRNVLLDEYIIMPNHVHGIVIIRNNHSTPQYQKLPVIVGSFKSATSKYIRQFKNYNNFSWQKSFHDHIIRDEKALFNIRKYIINNSLKWHMEDDDPKINHQKSYN